MGALAKISEEGNCLLACRINADLDKCWCNVETQLHYFALEVLLVYSEKANECNYLRISDCICGIVSEG